jgi:alkyl sulfatase BDS1-like metallo-beta-lactamase superfamily hydrolase
MRHHINVVNWKFILAPAALATGFLLFAGAPGAKADGCQARLNKADHRLHEAIEHRGPESREAEHWRHELHEAREYCWAHGHRWWDVDGNRWHTERDWDDRDHDRR